MVDAAAIVKYLKDARKSARVLIVDDEPAICRVLSMALEDSGLEAVTVDTAEEACVLLEKEKFRLLVSDKNLPKMSGLDLFGRCKTMAPNMPMVMMTGFASMNTVKQAMGIGAIDYIAKPFDDIYAVASKLAAIIESKILLATYERIAAALLNEIRAVGFDSELSALISQKLGALKDVLAESPDVLVFDDKKNCDEVASSFELAGLDTVRAYSALEVLSQLDDYPTLSVAVIAVDHPSSERLLLTLKSERHLKIVLSNSESNLKSTLNGFARGAVDLYDREQEDSELLASRIKHRVDGAQREQLFTRLFSILHAHSDLVGADLVTLIEELAPSAIREQAKVPTSKRKKQDQERMAARSKDPPTNPEDSGEFLRELSGVGPRTGGVR
jgi:DNA-binding NtrC family response regulator